MSAISSLSISGNRSIYIIYSLTISGSSFCKLSKEKNVNQVLEIHFIFILKSEITQIVPSLFMFNLIT